MKTLPGYILRQTLATLAVTVGVFTALLLLGSVLKEALELLNSRAATLGLVLKAVGLLIPFVLAFSLPISFLTATLLTFGRLSADQEITAARAGGISPATLAAPVIAAAVVVSGLCAWFNMDLAPRCRTQFKELRDGLLQSSATRYISEDRFVDLSPNLTLYAKSVHDGRLFDVLVYGTTNLVRNGATNLVRNLDVWAPEAEIQFAPDGAPASLRFHRLQGLFWNDGEWQPVNIEEFVQPVRLKPSTDAVPRLSDLTFGQLLKERRLRAGAGGALTPVDVQIHRQLSFSFACIGFALVGMPLGVRGHRRETNFGVAAALGLVLVYYSFQVLGQALEARPQWRPEWILWAPNFLFQGVGAILLRRADRGF
jgi:lipopolysaccharide export system permease protein